MYKIVVQCVPDRLENAQHMLGNILSQGHNDSYICLETGKGAIGTFIDCLKQAGTKALLLMEDDCILCKDFVLNLNKNIKELGADKFINFFTLKDIPETTEMTGSTYMSNLCVYIPENEAVKIIEFYETKWKDSEVAKENPTAMDYIIRDYLKDNKIKYFIVSPNLVQHQVGKSSVDKRRSSKRQSKYFLGEV